MKLHLNDEIRIPDLVIKRLHYTSLVEEYKNVRFFSYNGINYIVPANYEIHEVRIELADEAEIFVLLYTLESDKYKGSYKTALRKAVSANLPSTWDKDVIRQWCEEETNKTLSLCRVI